MAVFIGSITTLHSTETKVTKDGVIVTKNTYVRYNERFRRDTFKTRWYAEYQGKFGRGYSMKEAVADVMRKVRK